jgi:uncharacterized membrane protein
MRTPDRAHQVAAGVGVAIAGTGVWSFVAPRSFYRTIAEYPPYNEHFLHDIGAFLIGLGAALVLASVVADSLVLALLANSVGATVHAVSHIIDRDLGGAATDPWTLSAFAAALVAATVYLVRRTG